MTTTPFPETAEKEADPYDEFQIVYVGWYKCTGKARAEWRDKFTGESHASRLHSTLKAAKQEMQDWLFSQYGKITIDFRKI